MRFVREGACCALVMPTMDRARRIVQTLQRIAQTPGPDIEAIVVDNGSLDGTPHKIREAFDNVTVIELGANLGTAARNHGARAAKAPVVLMLDDDSGPYPGTVEEICRLLQDPSIGIIACPVVLPDGSFEEGGSRFVFIGCGAAFRRSVLLDIGEYPPEYETYVEEYDVAYRFLLHDLAVVFPDQCRVWHEPQARGSFDYMVEKLIANNGFLAMKYFPREDAARFISWIVYRYSVFAQQKNAQAGFRRAMEALPDKCLRGLMQRQVLPDRVLDIVMPQRETLPRFIALAAEGVRKIAFLRAGKEIPDLLRAAREAGLSVEAIYEPPYGLFAEVGQLNSAPVYPLPRYDPKKFERLVIGGASYGFIANTKRLAVDNHLTAVIAP